MDAYLDESGVHDGAAICVIAGYFGSKRPLKLLEKRWRQALARYDVPMDKFHARDLVSNPPSGFFRKWTKAQRDDFVKWLGKTIVSCNGACPISAGIVVADFNSFTLEQRRLITGATIKHGKLITTGSPNKPYFSPFIWCIRRLACYAPEGGKVHFFFGLNRPFADYAKSLLKETKEIPLDINCKERLGDFAFPLAKDTPQLQAADLLVHLTYQFMLERQKAGSWDVPPEGILGACVRNAKGGVADFIFLDKRCLQAGLDQSYEIEGKKWDKKQNTNGKARKQKSLTTP